MMVEPNTRERAASAWRTVSEPESDDVDCACACIEAWIASTFITFVDKRLAIGSAGDIGPVIAERLDCHYARIVTQLVFFVPVASYERRSIISYVATLGIA